MKRGLQSFVFLFVLLFVLSGLDSFGQGRDEGGFVEKIELPVIQRGARSPEVITSLDANYCSQGGYADIYLDPADIPSGTIRVVWTIKTNVGGNEEEHNGWVDPIGTDPNNGVRFFPDRVPSEFYGDAIFFQFQFYDGNITAGGDYDWTYVYKSPEIYTVTPAELHLCSGTTGTVTLSNSESGYEYFLYKDGVEQPGFIPGDDGVPLNFTVPAPDPSASPVIYTIEARRNSDPRCTVFMSGQTEVFGYDNPVPDPSSNSPVCEGESIVLQDSNAPVSGYQYIWEGPGLPVGGQIGHTVTVSDPSVIDNSGDYNYNLTIIDTNNPANCEATETITVTVNDNPVVNNIYNDSPACVGDAVTISIDVSGGSGPYTFSWTGPNGFSSTDEDPVLSNVTLADAGTYEVVVTDANGCGSTTASTVVAV
ncbi:immunoglobulin domain-containing protein, partial [Anaerophaga thermohalophila]|uniref:immunoglobulin domain-containing protein n=1 Tax=Anaerophaga thermohalophila TaxID=177400 RepID=UPI0005C69AAC